jgi:prepilin-type N-terminal cleavage/methylation domain-containing protein
MSTRRRTERGFTLLECTVALLLFTLLVVGLARLTVAHDRLVASTEVWLADDPILFVDVADDELERLLGVPARLVADAPAPPPAPPAPLAWLVTVTEVSRQLDPPAASALVVMTEP